MRFEIFFEPDSKAEIQCMNCGYEDCVLDFQTSSHIRSFYLLHYVVSGSGTFSNPRETFSLNAGDIFLIYPNELVSYESKSSGKKWSLCWMGLQGTMAERYLNLCGFSRENPVRKFQNGSDFLRLIFECHEAAEKNLIFSFFQKKEYAYRLLSLMEQPFQDQVQMEDLYFSKAVTYIYFNYTKNIRIHTMAEDLHLDRTYLFKIFKKKDGRSPQKFLNDYRIEQAKNLLLSTSYSIEEIGTRVGIPDPYHFSRLFKQIVKLSPKIYRQQNIQYNLSF